MSPSAPEETGSRTAECDYISDATAQQCHHGRMALHRAPMIGRDRELAALREAVAEGRTGHPSAVVVEGEAGSGKTRLVGELLEALRQDAHLGEPLVLRGACSSADRSDVPWAPFLDVLRDLRRNLGDQGFLELAGCRAGDLAPLDPGIPSETTQRVPEQGRMLGVLSGLLLDAAVRRPTVLVVEDVHWADEGSCRVLGYLVRSMRAEHLTVLVTVRLEEAAPEPLPGIVGELVRSGSASRLRLARLDRDGIAEQLHHLLGSVPDPDVVDKIDVLSAGLPLFVEEAADALADDADLSQLSGVVHGHRLAGLPRQALLLAETAAVAVTPPSAATLHLASGLEGEDFDSALAGAVSAGVLSRRRPLIEFRHAVLREATLDGILPNREREIHLRWADVLEPEADGLEATVTVAHHRLVAGEPSAALVACARAADAARDASGFGVQLEMLREVSRLWPRVDRPEELAHRDLVDVLGQAAEAASFASTDAAETQRLARQARALLRPGSSPARSAWLDLLVLRSRYTESEQIPIEEVLAVVEQIPSEPATRERVVACAFATHHLLQAGRTGAAELYVAEGVRSAYVLGLARLEEEATSNEALLRLHQGRYRDAMRSAIRARRIADAGGDDLTRADSYGLLALIHWHVGDPVAASENCRRAVEILGGDRPGPFPFTWGMNATNLAETLVEQGEWTEAQHTLDHVLAVPDLPDRIVDFACRLARHLRLWRDGLDPDYVVGDATTDPILETLDLQDLVPCCYTDADISSHHHDLARARAELRVPLSDDRTVQLPEALYNVLSVAARTEADAKAEGWPDPDPEAGSWAVGRIEHLLGLMTPTGGVEQAQDAHVRADLARWAGQDDATAWVHVVRLWRRVPHPRSLALALLRLGTVAAGAGDTLVARNSLAESLRIAERLGARPLMDAVHEAAKAHGLRIGALPGARGTGALLTGRELEVLHLVADGASNADIAAGLFISPKTVSVHVSHILEKLGVGSRTAAAARAREAGLLDTQDVNSRDGTAASAS